MTNPKRVPTLASRPVWDTERWPHCKPALNGKRKRERLREERSGGFRLDAGALVMGSY